MVIKGGGGGDVDIFDVSVLHAQSRALAFCVRGGLKTLVGVNFIFHCIFEKWFCELWRKKRDYRDK